MTRFLWLLLRFSLCVWVGAASLFVVSVVREVTTPFEMLVKNQLVALRFPVYYSFGFALLSLALLSSGALLLRCTQQPKRLRILAALCAMSLLLMLYDYFQVYLPLEAMVLSPKYVIPPDFFGIHQWSKWMNLAAAVLSVAAALMSVCDEPASGA